MALGAGGGGTTERRSAGTMALQYCKHAGCHKLTKNRYCSAHEHLGQRDVKQARAEYDATRPNSNERGYSFRWHKYAQHYLRSHPLCVMCDAMGRTQVSQCVDHRVPVSGPHDPLFWKRDNHQALCLSCHSAKTRTDGRREGRRAPLSDEAVFSRPHG